VKRTLQILNELEDEGVFSRYAIAGAMAATFYAEPLLTFDLDVVIALPPSRSQLVTPEPVYEALRRRGYVEEKECVLIEGVLVRFLPACNSLLEEALGQARDVEYEEVRSRVLRAEHLIAICLQTDREKETIDNVASEVAKLFEAKRARRLELAALSFPQKVAAVVRLQEMAAPILRQRGQFVEPWKIVAGNSRSTVAS
jgi:hypothetical protein